MKNIISKIESLVNDNINTYLPDVSRDSFEENGAVYYMNGKNGMEFDRFVNDRLSDFFVFYDDEESLGAVKFNLYYNGDAIIYINDYHNIALLSVGAMCQTDPDIAPHIGNPVGTGLIRVSSDSLEIDKRDKPIFFEKREM